MKYDLHMTNGNASDFRREFSADEFCKCIAHFSMKLLNLLNRPWFGSERHLQAARHAAVDNKAGITDELMLMQCVQNMVS